MYTAINRNPLNKIKSDEMNGLRPSGSLEVYVTLVNFHTCGGSNGSLIKESNIARSPCLA